MKAKWTAEGRERKKTYIIWEWRSCGNEDTSIIHMNIHVKKFVFLFVNGFMDEGSGVAANVNEWKQNDFENGCQHSVTTTLEKTTSLTI